MIVKLSDASANDLTSIRDFISRGKFHYAGKSMDDIFVGLNNLEQFSNCGVCLKNRYMANVKYLIMPVGDFLIFYTVEQDRIEVDRVLHSSTDYLRTLLKK